MRLRPFPDQQKFNPSRKPTWRWDRASHLVDSKQYFSKKRDDTPTGIAVAYLRDQARCRSDLRLRRVREKYQHVAAAREIWAARDERLELEARILARQSDTAIGLEMGMPGETVQAYRDLLYQVDDRIDSAGYIMSEVIGIRPGYPSSATALMLASAYAHGPAVIESWLRYLGGQASTDLTTEVGRAMARIDLLIAAHALPYTPETQRSLVKLAPILFPTDTNSTQSGSVARAFGDSTAQILATLDLSAATLPPLSYAPISPQRHIDPNLAFKCETRRAA